MMVDPSVVVSLSEFLRRFVPLTYLGMALYLGLAGGHRSLLNWTYISLYGLFGVATYMLLNEPTYRWVPIWVSSEMWVSLTLLCTLVIGILLFLAAIELQDLDPPQTWLRRRYRTIRDWLY